MGRYLEKVRSLEQALTRPVAPQPGRTPGGNDINDIHDKTPLQARLAKGAKWLADAWNALPPGQEPDGRFDKVVDVWADLCEEYYRSGGPQGCALGPAGPCAPGAFIVCPACIAADHSRRAPEGWSAAFEPGRACPKCRGRIFWTRGDVRQCVGCYADGPVAEAKG